MSRTAKSKETNGNFEMVVDVFAGAGGASLGIEKGLGRPVDIALNHDRNALEVHQLNHPKTHHLLGDVWDYKPLEVTFGRPVGLAWFSPDCKHFSRAKGGKPVSTRVRALAWVVVRWAEQVRPRVIILENVPEFTTWGPLDRTGQPVKDMAGDTFKRWRRKLVKLGYAVESRELVAADYGVPTTRKRFFLVAKCDGQPIVWPVPKFAQRTKAAALGLKAWRSAAECIDWSLACPSIFERKRPLAEATMQRIANGLRKFVLETNEPFIVSTAGSGHPAEVRAFLVAYYTQGSGKTGSSLREPAPTITTKHRLGLVTVAGADYQVVDIGLRMLTPDELLRAQFGRYARKYKLLGSGARRVAAIGNSVPPELAEALVRANVKIQRVAAPAAA